MTLPTTPNKPKKRPLPLASYPPEFRETLLRGAASHFQIPCESYAAAKRLQAQLQAFRFQYAQEKRTDWELLYRTILRIKYIEADNQDGKRVVLDIAPRGEELSRALAPVAEMRPGTQEGSSSADVDPLAVFEPERGE